MDDFIKTKAIKKRLSIILIVTSAVLFSLYCFILAPLYTYMCADITFSVTFLPELLSLLINVVDVASYAICFAVIIYSVYKFTFRGAGSVISIFCAAVFLKYTVNSLVTWIMDGTISFADITPVFVYFLLDVIFMLAIAIISNAILKRHHENISEIKKAAARLSTVTKESNEVFPFKKLFDKSNPLHRSALFSGIIMGGVKILTRAIYDLF